MGVYVPGMNMPTTCCHCAFMYFDPDATNSNNGNPGSYLCSFTKAEIWNTQRDPQCPLIHVPDHGDLVDRSPLEVLSWKKDEVEDSFDAGVLFVCDKLDALPVVIPAEGEDYT